MHFASKKNAKAMKAPVRKGRKEKVISRINTKGDMTTLEQSRYLEEGGEMWGRYVGREEDVHKEKPTWGCDQLSLARGISFRLTISIEEKV